MRRGMQIVVPLSFFCALAIAGALPVAPQQPDDSFAEVIDVRVVNLEVVVTDSQGERFPGLTLEDLDVRNTAPVHPGGAEGGNPGVRDPSDHHRRRGLYF